MSGVNIYWTFSNPANNKEFLVMENGNVTLQVTHLSFVLAAKIYIYCNKKLGLHLSRIKGKGENLGSQNIFLCTPKFLQNFQMVLHFTPFLSVARCAGLSDKVYFIFKHVFSLKKSFHIEVMKTFWRSSLLFAPCIYAFSLFVKKLGYQGIFKSIWLALPDWELYDKNSVLSKGKNRFMFLSCSTT